MNTSLLAACALAVLGANALVAQASARPVRLWTVSVSRSLAFATSTRGVEQAMRAGGFDDQSCLFSCIDHPFSIGGPGSSLLTARRAFPPRLQIVAVYGHSHVGESFGFQADTGEFALGTHLFLSQSVQVIGVLAGISTTSGATWLAAGPAYFQPSFHKSGFPRSLTQKNHRLGSTVAAGISNRHRFFVEAQGQYRLVGSVDLGPVDVNDAAGSPVGSLPQTKVNFDHYIVSVGLGVRW